jgi:hypothetical protein
MWRPAAVGFIVGTLIRNGIPHFVQGITKENYPSAFGDTPIPNLITHSLTFGVSFAPCAMTI